MRVLKDSRWLSGSFIPSWVSKDGIQNLSGNGQDVTCAIKGDVVRCTRLSSVAVPPFISFIIRSILSFIAFILVSHCALLVLGSQSNASCLLVRLLGTLLSILSSSQWSFLDWWWLVRSWWLLASSRCFRSCSTHTSNAWFYCTRALFYWASHSIAAESICSCLSMAVASGGISSFWVDWCHQLSLDHTTF